MVLKLYAYDHSSASKRVSAVLNEKNVPFEFVMVDMGKGEHKAPPTITNQPWGALPWIVRPLPHCDYDAAAHQMYSRTTMGSSSTNLAPSAVTSQPSTPTRAHR